MDRDAAHTHAKPKHHDYYFPPVTPDAAIEDANVRLGLRAEPRVSLRDRLETHVSLATIVAVLTALTLSIGIVGAAVKVVAAATRHYDQMERVLVVVAHLDSTVARLIVRVDQLEARKPLRVGGAR